MQHAHFVVVVVVVAVVVVVVVPSVVPSNDSPGLHVGSTGAAAGALSP
jgi:competence protein ComGC